MQKKTKKFTFVQNFAVLAGIFVEIEVSYYHLVDYKKKNLRKISIFFAAFRI